MRMEKLGRIFENGCYWYCQVLEVNVVSLLNASKFLCREVNADSLRNIFHKIVMVVHPVVNFNLNFDFFMDPVEFM